MTDDALTNPADEAPRRGPPARKHLDVLWAAARLFARQGVGQTTTREIAAAAATTERTLFKHFGSKEGLVRAVIDEAVLAHLAPQSLEGLRRAIGACGDDLRAWHRALLHQRLRAWREAPELTRLLLVELLRDEALRADFAARWRAAAWEPMTGLLAGLQREGRLDATRPPAVLARLLLSLNLGYLVARVVLAPGAAWDDEAEIEAIAALFSRGAAPAG